MGNIFCEAIREGEIGNGYPLCKTVAADIESKNLIPLYCEAYSHSSPDVKSENNQIFKAIDAIYKHVGDKGIHAIDGGGDRGVIFDKHLNRDKPQRFVIQLVERDLIQKGQKKNCLEMATALPTPYETVMIVYDNWKERKKMVQYNAVPVKLPGHDNDLYLVVVKGFGQKAMMLLTSCPVEFTRKRTSGGWQNTTLSAGNAMNRTVI